MGVLLKRLTTKYGTCCCRSTDGSLFVWQNTGHFCQLFLKRSTSPKAVVAESNILFVSKATSFLSPKQHPFFFCQPTVTLPLNKSPFAISYFSSRLITANSFLNPTHSQLSTTFLRNSFGPLPERRNST